MIDSQKLFRNYFDDVHIIPSRLGNFASDVLNHLIAANTSSQYNALISLLQPVLNKYLAEQDNVDTSLNIQKGATLTNNQVIAQFKTTMSTEEPFVARALGGKDTSAYLQFYPRGLSDYNKPSKTSMPVLTNRVNVAATANAAALGATLTATLQAFEASWASSRNSQQQQMGTVDDNRSGRSDAGNALALALITVIHSIGAMFPGNVKECSAIFNFNLLFAHTKHKHRNYAATLLPTQTLQVLNRTFTDTATLTIRNPDDNAPFVIWLAATAGEAPPQNAPLTVQPGQAHQLKPSQLGNLANTFLLVHNSSEVNEGAYEVEVVG